jgi:NAD(P)-dependent dehydrogenase (short-subunit alcohol dehydrogenase family)
MATVIDLAGQVALVTGGARGVGAGITRALLAAGADVVVCGRTEPASLPAVQGRRAVFRAVDVRDAPAATALVNEVAETYGRLDVLVNNAGGAPYAEAERASPRFHSSVVALNLLAPLTLSQAACPVMREQGGGSIVMISSVSAVRPSPGTASYGAAKAGLNSLVMTLAVEWAPSVRVNGLVVGAVHTEQSHLHYGDDEGVAAVGALVPLGRLAEPDDVGGVCVFLASPLARYVSGALIAVHGGGERPPHLEVSNRKG